MPYLSLDDRFFDSPRIDPLSDGAFRLLVSMLCHCVKREEHWRVSVRWIERLTPRYDNRHLQELIQARLVDVPCDGFYHIVDQRNTDGRALWRAPKPVPSRPKIDPELRATVYERDEFECRFCGSTEDLTLDHIHPWSKGGQDTLENLQTLCRTCNSKKGVRLGAVVQGR